ncbi:Zinc-finger associated domain (zf-AD) [Popillia japonica]|uniref:Zinc-finger associated domain (Zf-AD) n=1 Tax=Popillia japonica TaxID=7064 RepID=A0AAW1LFF8_POPJA
MVWTRHLCRICAQIGDACYPIFDSSSGRNIEMKMQKCFSFIVFTDDYKPKEICNCCYMKLNDLYEFIEMCYTSNNKFETMVFSSNQGLWLEKQTQSYDGCHLNGVIVNSKNNLDGHLDSNVVMVVDYENPLQLNQATTEPGCLNTSYNNTDLVMRTGDISKQKSEIVNFKTCLNTSYNNTDLVMRTGDISKQKSEIVNFKTYQCYEQSQTVLRHSSDFYKSLETSTVNSFINMDDNVINYTHINEYKKQEETICGITNISNEEILQENNINIEAVKLPGKDCLKLARNKKTFSCQHCTKMFVRKSSLNVHLAVHSKIRPYPCDLCNKSFVVERDLRSHKRIHSRWLTETLGIIIEVYSETFVRLIQNGYLVGAILRHYNVITADQLTYLTSIGDTGNPIDKVSHWLKLVNIHLNDDDKNHLLKGKISKALELLYELYLIFHGKDLVHFTAKQLETEKLREGNDRFKHQDDELLNEDDVKSLHETYDELIEQERKVLTQGSFIPDAKKTKKIVKDIKKKFDEIANI